MSTHDITDPVRRMAAVRVSSIDMIAEAIFKKWTDPVLYPRGPYPSIAEYTQMVRGVIAWVDANREATMPEVAHFISFTVERLTK